MPTTITWHQALTWRMKRHRLDPIGPASVEDVVRGLCGVQSQVASTAELAIRVRRSQSAPGDVATALADGRLIKTWAMRGTLHLLTPEEGGAVLSLIAAGRTWERPSWQRYFGLTPQVLEQMRVAVREALDGSVLTREELGAAVTARPGLEHIGQELASSWGTLLKPLAWQGDIVCGPARGGRATFMRPEAASTRWAGVPDPDEAAPGVIAAYLRAYGPATWANFHAWLARGWSPGKRIKGWFAALGDRLAEVDVDGDRAFVLAEDLDGLAATAPSTVVRLLPGFDQYVLGPGTDDGHVTPAARRTAVSKQSGWIAPVVVAGGVVAGTWQLDGNAVRVAWFREAGTVPGEALESEVARLGAILQQELWLAVELA